ncbi:inositol monophosphatase family protein [Pseudonocardia sp. CA-107938]|uniref:inositol monophosphatase family protein n=1 Tax=Pseudonocardia sp. CA-107938 TaxID=3240021 RepID=UPI003D90334D
MTVQQSPDAPAPPPVDPGLLSRALEVAGRLANDAAEVITATAGRDRRTGPDYPYDWVTDTDHTLERHTRRVLAAEFPDVPVGEPVPSTPFHWLVAPVDGVANYVAGLPWCAYSLALVDAFGPVVGVIADPSRAHIYAAARGRGVRANGVPVQVAARPAAGGLVCTELLPSTAARFAQVVAGHVGLRVLGSAALAITEVALGHAVAAVLDGYRDRDVAGAVCLAREAGALAVEEPDGLVVAVPGAVEEVLGWWRAG